MTNPLTERRTRIKLAIMTAIFLLVIAILGIFKGMEGLASACVGGMMTISTTYIFGETKRPSENKQTVNYEHSTSK